MTRRVLVDANLAVRLTRDAIVFNDETNLWHCNECGKTAAIGSFYDVDSIDHTTDCGIADLWKRTIAKADEERHRVDPRKGRAR